MDWRSLYPDQGHRLDLQGVGLHYLDHGSGDPILCVHGNPTWSFYWRAIVAGLSDQARVVVPDHIGCGLSDKPQDYPYRLAQHAENLRRLIESLDLRRITLVAHDWGGAIGLLAAVRDPDRFARICLLNTGAFRTPHIPWRIAVCRWPVLGALGVRGLNAFARAALALAVSRRADLSPAVRAGLIAPYDNWANRVAIHRFVQDIPMHPRHPSYAALVELEQGLESLRRLPRLLIWGMRDWCFTPWFLDRFLQVWPDSQVVRLDDVGHYVMEQAAPRVIDELRRFTRSG